MFPCEDCGYVYSKEFNLKRHRKERHAILVKRVKVSSSLLSTFNEGLILGIEPPFVGFTPQNYGRPLGSYELSC